MKIWSKTALSITLFISLLLVLSAVFAFSASNPQPDHSLSAVSNGTFTEVMDLDNDGRSEIIVNSVSWPKYEDYLTFNNGPSSIAVYHVSNGVLRPKAVYGTQSGNPFGIAIGKFDFNDPGFDIAVTEYNADDASNSLYVLASPSWSEKSFATDLPGPYIDRPPYTVTAVSEGLVQGSAVVIAVAEQSEGALVKPAIIMCTIGGPNSFDCSRTHDVSAGDALFDPILAITSGDVGAVSAGGNIHYAQDNSADIVAVTRTGRVIILYRRITGGAVSFVKNEFQQAFTETRGVAIGDADNDGDNDIIVVNADNNNVVAYLQEPNVAFNPGWSKLISTGTDPSSIAVGDVDSDDIDDVIVGLGDMESAEVYIQHAQTGLPAGESYVLDSTGLNVFGVGVGDVNGDSLNDIITTTMADSKVAVFFQEVAEPIPELGERVQIIPRWSTVHKGVTAYSVSKPYLPCSVSAGDNYLGSCNEGQIATIRSCDDTKDTLLFQKEVFNKESEYSFLFNTPQGLAAQKIVTGSIGLTAQIDENRLLTVTTTKDIKGKNSALKYQLYRKEACGLVAVGEPGEFSQTVPGHYKNFHKVFQDPECEANECNFVAEIFAHSAGDVGGTVVEFVYAPEIVGVTLNVVSSKESYHLGESALIRARVSDISIYSLTYDFVYPASLQGKGGRLSYNDLTKEYRASFPVEIDGDYLLNVTARPSSGGGRKLISTASFTVTPPLILSVSPQFVDFGTVFETDPIITRSVILANYGTDPISNISLTFSSSLDNKGLSYEFENRTILSNSTETLNLTLEMPDSGSNANHTGSINLTAPGMQTESVSVAFSFYYEDAVIVDDDENGTTSLQQASGSLDTSAWSLGTVMPGSSTEQIVLASIQNGLASEFEVKVLLDGDASNYISPSTETISDLSQGVSLSFNAPEEPDKYAVSVRFQFVKKSDGTLVDTITLPITFEVVEDGGSIVDDAKTRLSRVRGSLGSVQAKAGAGTDVSEEIQSLVSLAEEQVNDASASISSAEELAALGDEASAEDLLISANSALNIAEDTLSQINAMIATSSQDRGSSMSAIVIPLVIFFAVILIIGLVILALREGWIPADKVPWLKSAFEAIGLGTLVESSEDFKPELRFSPEVKKPQARPVTARPGVATKPPAPTQPTGSGVPPRTGAPLPGQNQQEKYKSYYNRRLQR
tara:strand:+ start:16972 stop:20523 length:3552 start_codon:yes stop_codon:yes gene_type:complete